MSGRMNLSPGDQIIVHLVSGQNPHFPLGPCLLPSRRKGFLFLDLQKREGQWSEHRTSRCLGRRETFSLHPFCGWDLRDNGLLTLGLLGLLLLKVGRTRGSSEGKACLLLLPTPYHFWRVVLLLAGGLLRRNLEGDRHTVRDLQDGEWVRDK